MKIAFTSDLHVNSSSIETYLNLDRLYQKMNAQSPDYVIFGGDIVEPYLGWEAFLKFTKEHFTCPIAVILGNHDLWHYGKIVRNREIIYDLIWDTCSEHKITFLQENPIIIGDTLLVGSIGWYDYSIKPVHVTTEYLMLNKNKWMNDGVFIESKYNDIEYEKTCRRQLLDNIKKHSKNINNIFVFTHVPLLKDMVVSAPHGHNQMEWETMNAYFYNVTLGNAVVQNPKVKFLVAGHIHRYMSGTTSKGISYVSCGSDYFKPEYIMIDTEKLEATRGTVDN